MFLVFLHLIIYFLFHSQRMLPLDVEAANDSASLSGLEKCATLAPMVSDEKFSVVQIGVPYTFFPEYFQDIFFVFTFVSSYGFESRDASLIWDSFCFLNLYIYIFT